MYGSVGGNIVGILYFLIYQIIGILFALQFFKKEKTAFCVLMGSIIGSFSLQWFPVISSFFMGFTKVSHIAALILFVILILLVEKVWLKVSILPQRIEKRSISVKEFLLQNKILWVLVPTAIYFCIVLWGHTIPMKEDGAIYTGQCTYGDMNMHLGFITSIAKQGTFPPDYSILPGVRLSYPFLCDSISSSIYVFGSSLRIAYMLPMVFALLQVFGGFYWLIQSWLKDKGKTVIAWILFFFNGGFGFVYFLDKIGVDTSNFTRIFTGFYETPTNLVDENIRWSNIIVDMLLPQRATLFGWAILFGTLALLWKAVEEKNKKYFIGAAVLGGGLPMIHTHSFMALGIVCAVWLLGELFLAVSTKRKSIPENGNETAGKNYRGWIIGGVIVLMCYIQSLHLTEEAAKKELPVVLAFGIIVLFAMGITYLVKAIQKGLLNQLLSTWGIFLGIILVLSLPQLFLWTFQQVGEGGFVRGYFNWANEADQYIWFYVKNIGITAILAIPAYIGCKRKNFLVAAPALVIWFIGELMVMTPNVYDNNKLLYVGYMFVCGLVADLMVNIYRGWKKGMARVIYASAIMGICSISAVLTMGREYVSEYQLYDADQIAVCEYIEKNMPTDAVILTNTRHNNAISSLTGRNIVCGTGTFLYYHGLDYQDREIEVGEMYTNPAGTTELLKKYNVSYILIGPDEWASYENLDENTISQQYECVYEGGSVRLYKVQFQ